VTGSPCPSGQVCQADVAAGAKCVVAGGGCTPNCTNKTCGEDGCGGLCGTCTDTQYCDYTGGNQTCATGVHCPDSDQATSVGSPWPMDRGCASRMGLTNAKVPGTAPTVAWNFPFGATYTPLGGSPTPTPVRSAPVLDRAGNVFIYGPDGAAYKISSTGAQLWKIALGGSGYENGVKRKLPSPVLDDTDHAFFVSSSVDTNPPASKLYKLKAADGVEAFNAPVGRFAYSSPLIDWLGVVWLRTDYIEKFASGATTNWATRPSASVGTQYGSLAIDRTDSVVWTASHSIATDPLALAINRGDGSSKFKYGVSDATIQTNTAAEVTPVLYNGLAILQDQYGSSSGNNLRAIRLTDGTLAWSQFTLGTRGGSSAVTRDGEIYTAYEKDTVGEVLIARKLQDGGQRWAYKHTANVGFTSEPVVDGNGRIIVGDASGKLLAISRNGIKIWEVQVCAQPITTAAAIDLSGRIYVGCDDGKLYALGD